MSKAEFPAAACMAAQLSPDHRSVAAPHAPRLLGRAMTQPVRGTARARKLLLLGSALIALAACEPTANAVETSPNGASNSAKPQRSTRIVDRDVEAPQVFQVTETALWDGRPSLGGVWVASPDVTDPERVIMRNAANGKFVIGALFKRERDNPGPKLQISSDAADALGLLAGQPGQISVTALRREQAPETGPDGPVLDSNESLATAVAGAAGASDATAKDASATKAGATQAAAVKAGAIDAGGVTSAPLDGPAPAQASAAALAPQPSKAAAAAAAPAVAKAADSGSGRPIQIGYFSVEANAARAVDTLAKAGVKASLRKESAKGKDYWTVFARGDAALVKKIKAAGFADAYLLK